MSLKLLKLYKVLYIVLVGFTLWVGPQALAGLPYSGMTPTYSCTLGPHRVLQREFWRESEADAFFVSKWIDSTNYIEYVEGTVTTKEFYPFGVFSKWQGHYQIIEILPPRTKIPQRLLDLVPGRYSFSSVLIKNKTSWPIKIDIHILAPKIKRTQMGLKTIIPISTHIFSKKNMEFFFRFNGDFDKSENLHVNMRVSSKELPVVNKSCSLKDLQITNIDSLPALKKIKSPPMGTILYYKCHGDVSDFTLTILKNDKNDSVKTRFSHTEGHGYTEGPAWRLLWGFKHKKMQFDKKITQTEVAIDESFFLNHTKPKHLISNFKVWEYQLGSHSKTLLESGIFFIRAHLPEQINHRKFGKLRVYNFRNTIISENKMINFKSSYSPELQAHIHFRRHQVEKGRPETRKMDCSLHRVSNYLTIGEVWR